MIPLDIVHYDCSQICIHQYIVPLVKTNTILARALSRIRVFVFYEEQSELHMFFQFWNKFKKMHM